MFRFMLQKLRHKKWMVLCLLIGNILLIAVAASQSIYKTASFERMLKEEFEKQNKEDGVWSFLFSTAETVNGEENIQAFFDKNDKLVKELNVPVKETITHVKIKETLASSTLARENAYNIRMSVGYISDMENHIEKVSGTVDVSSLCDDGSVPVIVNQEGLSQMGILMDEVIAMDRIEGPNGEEIKIKVVGIFKPKNISESYWVEPQKAYSLEVFTSKELLEEVFTGHTNDSSGKTLYDVKAFTLFDYEKMDPDTVSTVYKTTEKLVNGNDKSIIKNTGYQTVLNTFLDKKNKISATLFILQVPCLLLLCAFLYMISGQMLQMEQNEISMLKSRGAKQSQILWIYTMQSTLLSAIGLLIGLPLGLALCSLLGSAGAFLEFDLSRLLATRITGEAILYSIAAMAVSILMTVIPVIGYSKVSIVNLKQNKMKSGKNLWQKLGLDIILTGVGVYGFYSFSKSAGSIKEQILSGNSLDPLLYFCATFFILGLGLLFLRIQPMAIKLVYTIRKKRLSPAAYMSFLSTIRTASKQQFIMLFMILTVSLGMFYATIARTILDNAEENMLYLGGTDVVLEEKWKDNSAFVDGEDAIEYYEPNFGDYESIEGVTKATKVLYDNARVMRDYERVKAHGKLMGIKTKEFGEITNMPDGLMPYDYYTYLNTLAQVPDGVLMSENMKLQDGYKIGDSILVQLRGRMMTLRVIGFVDYWPGYKEVEYSVSTDGKIKETSNNLMIANLAFIQQKCDVTPYQVWMQFDKDTSAFYTTIAEKDIKVLSYKDTIVGKEELRQDTLLQGTNGSLSLSFMIILILCAVGYLIYWILSIRSRELLFGILRAMGMGKKEVLHILLNEQIFCGLLSILAGVGIGTLASRMFVPMIQNAYAATDQVLPLNLVCEMQDLMKLFITIAAVLIVCMSVLIRNISKMNISSALKLGED